MKKEWVHIGTTESAEETKELARQLAGCLKAGDIVLLSGDLGAGKTQFTQGLAAGLGATDEVISPTFNIVLTYESGRLPLHHFDLYRLESSAQLEDIGLREYLDGNGICVVEWAEKFPEMFDEFLAIDLVKEGEFVREVRAYAVGTRYEGALASWSDLAAETDLAALGGREGCSPTAARRKGAVPSSTGLPACASGETPPSPAEGSSTPQEAALPVCASGETPPPPIEDSISINSNNGLDAASERQYVLAFDTANEVVALGLGRLDARMRSVRVLAAREIRAHRASNTTLVPAIDKLLDECGVPRSAISCVCVGRGPGSFTGVRIAMAAAKGIASALGIGLVGVSTLDAVAWNAWASGVRGNTLVIADAMRKEVYPARFELTDDGVHRLSADSVVKAEKLAVDLSAVAGERGCSPTAARRDEVIPSLTGLPACASGETPPPSSEGSPTPQEAVAPAFASGKVSFPVDESSSMLLEDNPSSPSCILGDGLVKYRELYEPFGRVLDAGLWDVSGRGLLLALEAAWRADEADPLNASHHDPAFALPVYTRLSDAEENERMRLAATEEKNLRTGVQDVAPDGGKGRATMHSQAQLVPGEGADGVSYRPLDAAHVTDVAELERTAMGTDAWSADLVAGELGERNRAWWIAEANGVFAGYAGGLVVDGDLQVLKVAVSPAHRRQGIARELLWRIAEDARNLGASTCSLEVRASNETAQAFYRALGLTCIGTRPRYYSDREDAVIMQGPLPAAVRDVAGMELQHLNGLSAFGVGVDGGRGRSTTAARRKGVIPSLTGLPACASGETPPPPTRSDAKGYVDSVNSNRPLILAIESSCDETAAAIVDGEETLRSDVVASQIDFHARFGGVVPEIASRKHIEAICGVCAEALDVAGTTWGGLDAIAVTHAPGLLGALVVGVAFAKGAAWALDVPLVRVNHLEGHLYANKIGTPDFAPPAIVSLVSGGNTMLVHMRGWGDYEVLGATIDDAVGEAFDKVAKALGLGYPGGPVISRLAAQGNPNAIPFPRAMLHSHDLRFSLSGLKTAVVTHINNERAAGRELNVADIAASFQQAVVDVQVAKAKTALEQTGAPAFCLGGGVAANPALRAAYEKMCAQMGVKLVMPPLSSCGDNAGMIALVALDRYRQGKFAPLDTDAAAHVNLDEPY